MKKSSLSQWILVSLSLVTFAIPAYASDPCTVESEADSASSSSTLRYVVENLLNGRSSRRCDAANFEDGEYFSQSVWFETPETGSGSVEKINLGSPLEFDVRDTGDGSSSVVIGNVSQDALDDTTDAVNYVTNGNKSSDDDAYNTSRGEVIDYGMVVIDGRNLGERVNPFSCTSASKDVYLRNVIILTDKVSNNKVFDDCVKDGGNTWVCAYDYKDNSDPRTDSDWCTRETVIPHISLTQPWGTIFPRRWYADRDSDGFGNSADYIALYSSDPDYETGRDEYTTRDDSDCDDDNNTINPDASEICDGLDNNCDGVIDTDAIDVSTWYQDSDSDAYGNASVSTLNCDQPSGYVADSTDCDDTAIAVNPAATEICDGIDNNCDSVIDTDATDLNTWYADADSDSYGNAASITLNCTQPAGYVADASDCDDAVATINPAASEVCDTLDNNCDTIIDTDAIDRSTWYQDADADTYGNPAISTLDCTLPVGYVADNTDCDDTNSSLNTSCTTYTWYADADADGYGDSSSSTTTSDTTIPSGYVADGNDCDDTNSGINPGASEICDSIDNNCDSITDTDATDRTTWYEDADADTYGNASVSTLDCTQPTGYVADNTDCDDTDATLTTSCTSGSTDEGAGSDPELECADGTDNDGDLLTDCDDDGCYSATVCTDYGPDSEGSGSDPEDECSNGTDDDGDGLTDCDDPSCDGTTVCDESGEDGEGMGDLEEECSDGIDSDSDGLTDCDDDGCTYAEACAEEDVTEEGQGVAPITECTDGLDNDSDGLTDCDDTYCALFSVCTTPDVTPDFDVEGYGVGAESECTDGIDNDSDGLIDCNDSPCSFFNVCVATDVDDDPDTDTDTDTDTNTDTDSDTTVTPQVAGGTGSGESGLEGSVMGCNLNTQSQSNSTDGNMSLLALAVLFIFGLRFKLGRKTLWILALGFALSQATPAQAARQSRFDALNFTPAVDGGDYVTVYGAQTLAQWQVNLGLTFDYANHPLKYATPIAGVRDSIIDHMYTANPYAAIGLTDWFSAGVVAPVVLYNAFYSDMPALAPTGVEDGGTMLGDVQFITKFRLVDRDANGFGLALLPFVTLPTGDEDRYAGNGQVTGGGLLAGEFLVNDRFSIALNAGTRLRDDVTLHGVDVDDEFLYGVAANVDWGKGWQTIGEVQGSTVFKDFFQDASTSPLEGSLAVRHYFGDTGVSVDLGAAAGIVEGIGTPRIRGFAGLNWKGPVPNEKPAPVADTRIQGNKIVITWGKIFYDTNKTTIKPVSFPVLDEVVSVMQSHPEIHVLEVQGHTDARASDEYNMRLSQGRAESAMNYLAEKGVARDRLRAKGYGESQPIAPNDTDAGMAQNRRTEFVILESDS